MREPMSLHWALSYTKCFPASVPFVASDVGGIRDFTSELQQGCLVSPVGVTQLADRVVALLQDAPLRRKLVEAGLEQVQQFDVASAATRFLRMVAGRNSRKTDDTYFRDT